MRMKLVQERQLQTAQNGGIGDAALLLHDGRGASPMRARDALHLLQNRLKAMLSLAFGLWTAAAVAGGNAQYCVIDLSGGAEAMSYPVAYLDVVPEGGFNTDEFKTTKLVLKRVEAGSFILGEDQTNELHRVTLTKPYYMGLFEVTQKQWELVMGSNPSYFSGDTRPVERVSYDMIRGSSEGAQWPEANAVDDGSFLAVLRARTGIDFDLPTEAQWEYACRAGTTTTYSYGDTPNGEYMWLGSDSGGEDGTHSVGMRLPNPWGFYDMHGNVWEWCLDWKCDLPSYGVDPVGGIRAQSQSSIPYRIVRGGAVGYPDNFHASFFRYAKNPSNDHYLWGGFRLVVHLEGLLPHPSIAGDGGASVTGDVETGFVVKPSEGTESIVVTIPDGVDAAKVEVVVSPDVKTVAPNGAAVRVVRGEADVTDFLDIPAADASGVVDLSAATVKEEYAREPLDTAKDAKIDLSSPDSPSLTTAPTRKGLVYRLKEGATLETMTADADGDSTVGDGEPWTPKLSVTGGASGFYTIQVEK